MTEFDRTWSLVKKNPYDFSSWEYLIKLSETANGGVTKGSSELDIGNLRQVYSQFLDLFPLCYAYWKKFADWELSLVDTVTAEKVI
jgi:pre-mRNA-processing factor 39